MSRYSVLQKCAFSQLTLVLLATGASGCADDEAGRPALTQVPREASVPAPNEDDARCVRLPPPTDGQACLISWICEEQGRLTFACFNEEAGVGCGCESDEQFSDAFTSDLSACGDQEALAALARETCTWDVP